MDIKKALIEKLDLAPIAAKNIYSSYITAVEEIVSERVKDLEAELERVKKLFQAAKNYIDVCPCDPDITTEQLEAWNKYQELLKEKE